MIFRFLINLILALLPWTLFWLPVAAVLQAFCGIGGDPPVEQKQDIYKGLVYFPRKLKTFLKNRIPVHEAIKISLKYRVK